MGEIWGQAHWLGGEGELEALATRIAVYHPEPTNEELLAAMKDIALKGKKSTLVD
jgi:hypothetical protein